MNSENKTYIRKKCIKSRIIKTNQGRQIISCAQAAALMGRPLNRFITINWDIYGFDEEKGSKCTTLYLKKISDWLRKNDNEIAYIYVRENSIIMGNHVHILIHISMDNISKLKRMNRKWFRQITGQKYKRGTILSKTIGPSPMCYLWCPDLYDKNLKNLLEYFLKTADNEAVRNLSLRHERAKSLPMKHKVIGYSQGIGPKQRPKDLPLRETFLSDTAPPNDNGALELDHPVKLLHQAPRHSAMTLAEAMR